MAISETQKVDYLWKKLAYGRAKTDTNANKKATNESISSPLLLRGNNVWSQADLIPGVMPGSSSGVVTVYPTSAPDETTADVTATASRTWKTGLTDWIPPEIGSTYLVKVYIHTSGDASNAAGSGTQVFGAGSGNSDEWFFDYQAGTLHFVGTNLPNGVSFSGKSIYVSGARYTGIKGVAVPGATADFTDVTLTDTDTGSSAGPELKLYRNSASPADADYLGQIKFAGESDTGVERNYAKITGKISDASNGTEDGIIEFAHIKAGSQVITGRWNSTTLQLLNGTSLSVAGDATITGTITGNVTGNVTGNLTGDVTGNVTGNVTGDVTGNADTATTLETARAIGGVSFNGSADINLPGVNAAGNQDTSGTAALASGLTGTPNITVGTIGGTNLTLSGNLTVNGTTTTLNTATLDVSDLNITVAKGAADSSAANGAGLTVDGAGATFNYTHSGTKWVANKPIQATSFIGDITGDITGDVTGNADTATTSTNVTVADESTDTTCFPLFVTAASGGLPPRSGTNLTFNSSTGALTASSFVGALTGAVTGNVTGDVSGSSGSCTGNSATATALATARAIGGVNFDGTAAINLPGVNAAGNQDTSGNAATATILATARTIGGVSFDGSAAINLPGVNASGNQDTSGTAALASGLTGTPNISCGTGAFSGDVDFNGTGSIKVPVGTTVQRPSGVAGDFRYNTTTGNFEGYTDEWGAIAGGGSETDTSVSSTSATSIYTTPHATNRSVSAVIQITQGTAYQVGRYLVIHNGTTATIVEESAIATGDMLGSFTADINGSNLRILANMSSASSATVTILPTVVTV